MSHSFLDFADFDAAYRHSSTLSYGTATPLPLTYAGTPTLIHIRAPPARSLPIPRTSKPTVRTRSQSDTIPYQPIPYASNPSINRPVSAILVAFTPIHWSADSEDPRPGTPATLSTRDFEAVSPKSRVPSALQSILSHGGEGVRREGTGGSSIVIVEPLKIGKGKGERRTRTSVVALKSPYPVPLAAKMGVRERVKGWVRVLVGKLRR